MEELSIEEKAKRYDEALKVLHKYDGANIMFSQSLKEEMFPELAESKDERIRKELIAYCQVNMGHTWHNIKQEDYIAYLEKQGEQKPYGQRQECVDCQFNYAGECKGSCAMKRDEQKPANKVEPKFKVGDWVVYKDAVWKVCNISLQNYYELLKINNEVSTRLIKNVDKNAHLWTIQDAKDGDVLAYRGEQWIFIYKQGEGTCFEYYALVSENGLIINNVALTALVSCIVPAIKEQRDFLFQKMKEAGYEWDAEKKELKKIEQKLVVPKFKVGDVIRNKWSNHTKKIVRIADDNSVYFLDDGISVDCISAPISSQENWMLVEQKSAWSEEDEKMVGNIRSIIEKYAFSQSAVDVNGELCEKEYIEADNWLKSLKERYTWKPSDEQMEALYTYIYNPQYFDSPDPRMELVESVYKDLKKLREESS